jgi:hypothetical protein
MISCVLHLVKLEPEVLDIYRYEIFDWDDPELDPDPETNNLLHCQRADRLGAQAEVIVAELFRGDWAEVRFRKQTAEYSVVGVALSDIWLVLLEDSHKRGDWLRPVTGWQAEAAGIRQWEKLTGQTWRGRL